MVRIFASPGLDPGAYVFSLKDRNEKAWTAESSPAKTKND